MLLVLVLEDLMVFMLKIIDMFMEDLIVYTSEIMNMFIPIIIVFTFFRILWMTFRFIYSSFFSSTMSSRDVDSLLTDGDIVNVRTDDLTVSSDYALSFDETVAEVHTNTVDALSTLLNVNKEKVKEVYTFKSVDKVFLPIYCQIHGDTNKFEYNHSTGFICEACGRFVCLDCYDACVQGGMVNCPFCYAELVLVDVG